MQDKNKIAESEIKPVAEAEVLLCEKLIQDEQPKPLVAKFTNPLEFILMREEYVKKNPPAKPKKAFVKQRSVESDSEGQSRHMGLHVCTSKCLTQKY